MMIFFVGQGLDEAEREYGVRWMDIVRLWRGTEVGMIIVENPALGVYEQFNISLEVYDKLKEELIFVSSGGGFLDV